MTTVTGFTAERMLEIENTTVVDGRIEDDDLILVRRDDEEINAGNVRGPQGVMGMGPGMIPGEVRLFSGGSLPDPEVYGIWVWADGASYDSDDHPLAAAIIDDAWKTFGGASDPGAGFFRVPDLRGLVPAGLDTMPGGSAAGRVVRSEAEDIAGLSGEETHALSTNELARHSHLPSEEAASFWGSTDVENVQAGTGFYLTAVPETDETGGDDPHENMQPTVFVPYIVCLDG